MINEKEWGNGRIELEQHNCHLCKDWVLKLKIGGTVHFMDDEEADFMEEIFSDARKVRKVTNANH